MRKDDLNVFLQLSLAMSHDIIMMIQKQKNNRKCECLTMVLVQGKFDETKLRHTNGGNFLHEIQLNQVDSTGM